MKKAMTLTILATASLLAMPALAQQAPAAAPTVQNIADAMGVREKITATAIVQAVDQRIA